MKKDKKNKNPNDIIISFLFGAIIILAPLIVHLAVVDVSSYEYGVIRGSGKFNDVFIYCKSCAIIGLTVLIVLTGLLDFLSELGRKTVDLKAPAFFAALSYGVFVVLSTLFSSYKYVAVHGITERYEGMIMLLCYIALFSAAMFFIKSKKKLVFLICCILIGSLVIGIIGAGQFLGFDIFKTGLIAKLVYGRFFTEGSTLTTRFESIYSVLYNPNYVGSFFALTLPLSGVLALFLPFRSRIKFLSAAAAVIGVVNLIGSDSAGALLGVMVSVVFSVILGLVCVIKKGMLKTVGKTQLIFVLLVAEIVCVGAVMAKADNLSFRKAGIIFETLTGKTEQTSPYYWRDIKTDGDKAIIITENHEIGITVENDMPVLTVDGNRLDYTGITYENDVANYNYDIYPLAGSKAFISDGIVYFEAFDGISTTDFMFKSTDDGMVGVTKMGQEYPLDTEVDAVGFGGLEFLGSGRGYIWSRTLPLLFRTKIFLVGSGPDSFALEFPQNDIVGKTRFLGNPYVIVDKPHNLYLQTAVNTGVLSLATFVILATIYIISTLRSIFRAEDDGLNVFRAAIIAGIAGYLAAGISCDSTAAVAPYFWILLGIGCGLNRTVLSEE